MQALCSCSASGSAARGLQKHHAVCHRASSTEKQAGRQQLREEEQQQHACGVHLQQQRLARPHTLRAQHTSEVPPPQCAGTTTRGGLAGAACSIHTQPAPCCVVSPSASLQRKKRQQVRLRLLVGAPLPALAAAAGRPAGSFNCSSKCTATCSCISAGRAVVLQRSAPGVLRATHWCDAAAGNSCSCFARQKCHCPSLADRSARPPAAWLPHGCCQLPVWFGAGSHPSRQPESSCDIARPSGAEAATATQA